MTQFTVNGEAVDFRGDPETPLLWVLRDSMGLTGTKFGCGRAQCGACTVHVNGEAEFSCSVKVADVAGKRVNTIEGLAASEPRGEGGEGGLDRQGRRAVRLLPARAGDGGRGAAREEQVPSDADIDAALDGNLCRCGTYPRIREAVKTAAASLGAKR